MNLIVDGQVVSWCNVIDFQQQFGPGLLRMGGIGGVGTHDAHRHKGYCRRVMTSALRWMRAERYDLSMLYGITGLYPKFGYAEAFPEVLWTVDVRDAETAPRGPWRLTPFDAKRHLKAVLKLYKANNAGRTGITLRDPKSWSPFPLGRTWTTRAIAHCLCDPRGRVAGYLVHDSELPEHILEVGWSEAKVMPALLGAAADIAWARRVEKIVFHLPADDAFMRACRPCGLRCEQTFRRDGEAMVRLINVPAALAKLSAELAGRIDGRGELTIVTNLDTAAISWNNGVMSVRPGPVKRAATARLPQWALAQLIYGYADAESLHAAGTLRAPRKAVDTMAKLFPPKTHFHYSVDHF